VAQQIRSKVLENEDDFLNQLKLNSPNDVIFRESSCYSSTMDQPQTSVIYQTKPVQELTEQINNKTFAYVANNIQDYSQKSGKVSFLVIRFQQENARFKVKNSFVVSSARRQTGVFETGDSALKLEYHGETDGRKLRILNGGGSSGKCLDQKI
jgi:hypothetical protein